MCVLGVKIQIICLTLQAKNAKMDVHKDKYTASCIQIVLMLLLLQTQMLITYSRRFQNSKYLDHPKKIIFLLLLLQSIAPFPRLFFWITNVLYALHNLLYLTFKLSNAKHAEEIDIMMAFWGNAQLLMIVDCKLRKWFQIFFDFFCILIFRVILAFFAITDFINLKKRKIKLLRKIMSLFGELAGCV